MATIKGKIKIETKNVRKVHIWAGKEMEAFLFNTKMIEYGLL